jgi:hypothetical protein
MPGSGSPSTSSGEHAEEAHMKQNEHGEFARMDWNRFEENLATAAWGKRAGAPGDEALRECLGDEEYEYLQELAANSLTVSINFNKINITEFNTLQGVTDEQIRTY